MVELWPHSTLLTKSSKSYGRTVSTAHRILNHIVGREKKVRLCGRQNMTKIPYMVKTFNNLTITLV